MASVDILGEARPVAFLTGAAPGAALDPAALMAGLREVAALINRTAWTAEQRDAFLGMRGIVFFEGTVEVNGWRLDRSGCDEEDATFYWEAGEFLRNPDPRVRANIFFHDCWHVVQFRRHGFAPSEPERVGREIDAIDHQIVVAEALGCRQADVKYLRAFEADLDRIVARLEEGVSRLPHADDALG